jgi:hypothetical protein
MATIRQKCKEDYSIKGERGSWYIYDEVKNLPKIFYVIDGEHIAAEYVLSVLHLLKKMPDRIETFRTKAEASKIYKQLVDMDIAYLEHQEKVKAEIVGDINGR